MPTIEIVSIGCPEAPTLPEYPSFACKSSAELISHRGLFQNVFDSLTGVIVHLANKSLEGAPDGFWYAGAIMDWQAGDALVFLPDARRDVADLMWRLLQVSPERRATFSSDYQFGGERRESRHVTLTEFLRLHDEHTLHYNQLWYINNDGTNLEA